MEIQVLNGDALAEKFPIAGEIIVCREAIIDGPTNASDLQNCFQNRVRVIAEEKQRGRIVMKAYRKNDTFSLNTLSKSETESFAHLDRKYESHFVRPQQKLRSIISLAKLISTAFSMSSGKQKAFMVLGICR